MATTNDDQSLSELAKQLSQQTADLVGKELELARVELQDKAKQVGKGSGLLGGAAVLGLYAGGVLIAAMVLLIALVIEPWVAALIVGVILALVAGALAFLGRKKVKEGIPPVPEKAVETTKADLDTVRRSAKRQ